MALGTDFYPDAGERGIENFLNLASRQSLGYGDAAARYADPWIEERKKYIPQLANLVSNPGAIETSPFYKWMSDNAMAKVRASNAATGNRLSGRGLMALQDRAAGVASAAYPMLFDQYALLSGLKQSSPAAAALSYARSTDRSQDYGAMAAEARARGTSGRGGVPLASRQTETPWWMSGPMPAAPLSTDTYRDRFYSGGTGGTGALPYSGESWDDYFAGGGYTPSSEAGTGYVFSDYGATSFDPKGNVYEGYDLAEYE